MLDIIDISSWQGGMNLATMFARNPTLDGVIVKTTGGNYYVNEFADPWIQWLRANNKPWGFYHYLSEGGRRLTAQQEADWFLLNCENYFGEGIPFLDYEEEVAKALGPGFVHETLDEIYRRTGIKAGVYFSWGLKEWQDFSAIARDGYPFWCARYANSQFTSWQSHPWDNFSPAPWDRFTLLQYASTGRIPGWGGNLDLNLFYGSIDDWNALAQGQPAPEPLKGADPVVVAAVLLNEYGTDGDVPPRSERLRSAGYDPYAIQKKINELYGIATKVKPLVANNEAYLNSIVKIVKSI